MNPHIKLKLYATLQAFMPAEGEEYPISPGMTVQDMKVAEMGMRTDKLLFSESSGFVMEAKPGKEARLMEILASYGLEPMEIGCVTLKRRMVMKRAGEMVIDIDLDVARSAWTTGLAEAMR